MYIIINKTDNAQLNVVGDFPLRITEEMLRSGKSIIVVSTYSNVIKVPFRCGVDENGNYEYDWVSYPMPMQWR